MTGKETEGTLAPIRKIVDVFITEDGGRYFRIAWKDTWEPEEHLISCKDEIEVFWKSKENQAGNNQNSNDKHIQTDYHICVQSCSDCLKRKSIGFLHKSTQSHCTKKTCVDQSIQCVIEKEIAKVTMVSTASKYTSTSFLTKNSSTDNAEAGNEISLQNIDLVDETFDSCEADCQVELFSRDYASQYQVDVKGICIQVNPQMCSRGVQVSYIVEKRTNKAISNSSVNLFTENVTSPNSKLKESVSQTNNFLLNNPSTCMIGESLSGNVYTVNSDTKDVMIVYSSEDNQFQLLPSEDEMCSENVDDFLKMQLLKTLDEHASKEIIIYADNPLTSTDEPLNQTNKYMKKRQPGEDLQIEKTNKRQKVEPLYGVPHSVTTPNDIYGRSLFPKQKVNGFSTQEVLKLPSHFISNISLPLQAVNPHSSIVTFPGVSKYPHLTTYVQASLEDGCCVTKSNANVVMQGNNLSTSSSVNQTKQLQAIANRSTLDNHDVSHKIVASTGLPYSGKKSNVMNTQKHTLTLDLVNSNNLTKTTEVSKTDISLDESHNSTVYDPSSPVEAVPHIKRRVRHAAAVAEDKKIHNDFISKYWK